MRIKYHYAPAISAHSRLTNFLEKRNISYELCPLVGGTNYRLCVFDLYRDQDEFIEFRIRFPFLSWITESIEYTESEIETAEWLFIRSMSKLVKWECHSSAFQQSCEYKKPFLHDKYYKHSEQIKPLTVTQKMKWSTRRYFSGPDTAEDFIFCSKRAKNMLDGKWKGLNFFNVMNVNGEPYDDLYQLVFERRLPLKALCGGKETICRSCGRSVIRFKNVLLQLGIQKQFIPDTDSVYSTGDVLADSLIGFPTYSLNIVPQSFYQYCKEKCMNHGMIYEPVNLI